MVFGIWHGVLGHSPTVARLLTKLTTFCGHLPQGAPTSSALANLALLPAVKEVADQAGKLRLRVGQYVDDQAISGEVGDFEILTLACKAFSRLGLRISRDKKKLRIMRSGCAQIVTGLTVNSKVGIPKKERAKIRAAVRQLELRDPQHPDFGREWLSARGRVTRLARFHPRQGESLLRRLERCRATWRAREGAAARRSDGSP